MSKKNDDIENKQDRLEKTTQVYKAEGYVAVSKGCNYTKSLLLILAFLVCIDILCCLCSISGFLLFRYIIFSQTFGYLPINITNTTLELINIPTYYPTDMPTVIPSQSPTIEIPQ